MINFAKSVGKYTCMGKYSFAISHSTEMVSIFIIKIFLKRNDNSVYTCSPSLKYSENSYSTRVPTNNHNHSKSSNNNYTGSTRVNDVAVDRSKQLPLRSVVESQFQSPSLQHQTQLKNLILDQHISRKLNESSTNLCCDKSIVALPCLRRHAELSQP